MTDQIIIAALVVILILAASTILRKARSKASCCSGSSYTARARRLKHVAAKCTFRVEGMHCGHCANRIIEDIQDIPGTSARVNLRKGIVTVSMESPVEDAVLIRAIQKGGYKVTEPEAG